MLCQISEQTMRNIFQAYIQSSPHNKTSNKMVSGGSAHWQHCLPIIARYRRSLLSRANSSTWRPGYKSKSCHISTAWFQMTRRKVRGKINDSFPIFASASRDMCWSGCFHCWTLTRRTLSQQPRFKIRIFPHKTSRQHRCRVFFIPRPYLIPADAHAKLMKPPCGAKAAFPKSCHRICRKVHLFPDFGLGSWSWTLKTSRSKRYLECTVKTGQRWIHITDTTFHPRCFQLQLLGCSRIEIWTGTGQTKLCKETGNIKSDSSGEIEHRHFQRWLKKHEKLYGIYGTDKMWTIRQDWDMVSESQLQVLSHLRRLGMRKSVGDGFCLAFLCQARL